MPGNRISGIEHSLSAIAVAGGEIFMQYSRDPLHGVTLETIVTHLFEQYGWAELGKRININCFINDPSIKSSLKFLRRTPWARKKVEELYLEAMQRPNM